MSSKTRLVALLNKRLKSSYSINDVAFGKPSKFDPGINGNNTKITVTVKTGGANTKRYQAHYNRDNIAQDAINGELYVIVGVDYDATDAEVASALRAEYNLQIFDDDISEVRSTALSPFVRTIVAADSSLCWYGSVQVYLVPSDIEMYGEDNRTVIAGYSIPMVRR